MLKYLTDYIQKMNYRHEAVSIFFDKLAYTR